MLLRAEKTDCMTADGKVYTRYFINYVGGIVDFLCYISNKFSGCKLIKEDLE